LKSAVFRLIKFNSCNNSLFASMPLTHAVQEPGSLFWFHALVSLTIRLCPQSVPLPAEAGYETCERFVPLLAFIA